MPSPTLAVAQSLSVRGDVARNVARHAALCEEAARLGARLVVFPELSLTGYEPEIAGDLALTPADPRLNPLREAVERSGIAAIVGAPFLSPAGLLHIGAFALQPGGGAQVYAKQYLHPGEEVFFEPGSGGAQIVVGAERIAPAICADIAHAEHAAAAARAGAGVYAAGVLLTPEGYASDAALLQGYARLHHMLVLMANHGGPTGRYASAGLSSIWDERGELIAKAPREGEALILTPPRAPARTPP